MSPVQRVFYGLYTNDVCVLLYTFNSLSRLKAFNFYESPDPGNSSCRPFFDDDDSDKWLSRLERIIHIYTIYKSELLKTATSDDGFCKNLSRKNTQQYCCRRRRRRRIKINNIYFIFKRKAFNWRQSAAVPADKTKTLLSAACPLPSREFRWPNKLNVIKRN